MGSFLVLLASSSSAQPVCLGDCNGTGDVAINELLMGVNIALGKAPVAACPAFDASGTGQVTVADLVRAVGAALSGCPVVPTTSASDTPTQALTATEAARATATASPPATATPTSTLSSTPSLTPTESPTPTPTATPRFVDNGDGTVTDIQTNLTWEKKVAGSGCLHCGEDFFH